MHNKSMTVDGAVTIVGGRNIADEYFEIDHRIEFADFDMLGLGPVAIDVSRTFDLFWNSGYSVPLAALSAGAVRRPPTRPRSGPRWPPEFLARAERAYARAVGRDLIGAVASGAAGSTTARRASSPTRPARSWRPGRGLPRHARRARAMLEAAEREVVLVTPYLVPDCTTLAQIRRLRARGVEIVVVTNSLASTNHAYARRLRPPPPRDAREGVRLYEVMAEPPRARDGRQPPDAPRQDRARRPHPASSSPR
jgi:cardiolipin synthase C